MLSKPEVVTNRSHAMNSVSIFNCLLSAGAISASILSLGAKGATKPSAVALLHGAESALLSSDALRVRLVFEQSSPTPAVKLDCLIEMQGNRRRFESFPSSNFPGQVILIDGDEVKSYDRGGKSNVRQFGMRYEVGTSGDLAFDPRTIGLTDLLAPDATVKACIWDSSKEKSVVGKEKINGVEAWRVHVTTNAAKSDYWIEEPGFRIHQRTIEWAHGQSTIHSEFGSQDPSIPFPRTVTINRRDNSGVMERRINVTSFDANADIAPDRFTLASFNLPINTMVIDYRTQRVVGYWNGKELSESPFYPGSDSALNSPSIDVRRHLLLILANLIVIVLLVVLIWWRKRQAA